MIWQLELLVSAVDLFHERLEVNSAGSTVPISRPVFQSRLDGQSPIPSNGLNTIFSASVYSFTAFTKVFERHVPWVNPIFRESAGNQYIYNYI